MRGCTPVYNDTITLFCRKPGDRTGDTWYPTVIKNVNLNIDRAAILAKYGPQAQDNAVLHIRYTRDGGDIIVASKPYMPPKEWDQTEDSLTFTSGNDFDFFWAGEWDGGIVTDAEYPVDGGFYNHMNRTKDFVFAITSVAMYTVIPHFEIMGK